MTIEQLKVAQLIAVRYFQLELMQNGIGETVTLDSIKQWADNVEKSLHPIE